MSFTAGAGTRFIVTSASSQSSGTTLTGPITATAGTATTNTPAFDITQTWNNAGVTFTGFRFNITDTASNASSLLLDLQVGGSTRFNVRKDGTVNLSTNAPYINVPSGFGALQLSGTNVLIWQSGAVRVNGADLQIGATDTVLTRDAANTLAQRNATNAQTFRLYNTFTDTSNYERAALQWSGNALQFITESAGTGLVRSIGIYPGGSANHAVGFTTNGITIQAGTQLIFTPSAGNPFASGDAGLRRTAAGVLSTSDGSGGVGYLRTPPTTVAGLPAAATAGAGTRAFVTDANATTFASTVAGGGANAVPVVSNGTNWIIG